MRRAGLGVAMKTRGSTRSDEHDDTTRPSPERDGFCYTCRAFSGRTDGLEDMIVAYGHRV